MKKGIGDDIRQIGVVTKYELLKHLRSKRVLIFIGIAALLLALVTALLILVGDGLPDDPKSFMEAYLSFVFLMVIIGVSLVFAPVVAAEFEERTALLMFPKPIKKTSFFIGKVLACYILSAAVILLYYGICIAMSFAAAGGLDMNTFGSLGMALMFVFGAGGFALLMSSLFKKGSTAIIMTILTLFLIFNIVDSMCSMFEIEPVFSITYAALDIQNYISGHVTELQVIPMGGDVSFTFMQYYPTHALAFSVMAIYGIVTTVVSALLFSRREV